MTTSARRIAVLSARVAVLEAAVIQLTGAPLTPAQPTKDAISIDDLAAPLLASAAKIFGVSVPEILGNGKRVVISRARWAITWVLRDRGGFTLVEIGAALQFDHTSALYGFDRASELRRTDANFRNAIERLLEIAAPMGAG